MQQRDAIFVTCYALKGGVGRTTALANIGWYLASQGARVLLWDLDLEAPGLLWVPLLKKLFGDHPPSQGFVDYRLRHNPAVDPAPRELLSPYVRRASVGEGELFVLPATGALDETLPQKLLKISLHDPAEPLFLDGVRQRIINEILPDLVLIDARSGYGDLSALSTIMLADVLVVFFHPTEDEARAVGSLRRRVELAAKQHRPANRPLRIMFVASPAFRSTSDRAAAMVNAVIPREIGLPPDGFDIVPYDPLLAWGDDVSAPPWAVQLRSDHEHEAVPEVVKAYKKIAVRINRETKSMRQVGASADPPASSDVQLSRFAEDVLRVLRLLGYVLQRSAAVPAAAIVKEEIGRGFQAPVDRVAAFRVTGAGVLGEITSIVVSCVDREVTVSDVLSHASVIGPALAESDVAARRMIVSSQEFSDAAQRAALEHRIRLVPFADLRRRLVDFSPLLELQARVVGTAPAESPLSSTPPWASVGRDDGERVDPSAVMREWAFSPTWNHLLLLAEAGQAAKALALQVTAELSQSRLENANVPIPIRIDMNGRDATRPLMELIDDALYEAGLGHVGSEKISLLLDRRDAVLLLDAVDRQPSSSRLVNRRSEILGFFKSIGPNAKCVVACLRNAFEPMPEQPERSNGVQDQDSNPSWKVVYLHDGRNHTGRFTIFALAALPVALFAFIAGRFTPLGAKVMINVMAVLVSIASVVLAAYVVRRLLQRRRARS